MDLDLFMAIRFPRYPTAAYSTRDANTMTKQVPRYTSIDLTYEIFGKAAFVEDIRVVIVRTVVTPKATRAGVALRCNQKETQEMMTMRDAGM